MYDWLLKSVGMYVCNQYMTLLSYLCKMQYLLNLVLKNWEYLWF